MASLFVWGAVLVALKPGPLLAQAGSANEAQWSPSGIAVSLRELAKQIESPEARRLYGATRLLGYLVAKDERGPDFVLVLAEESGRPELKLDDLAVAYQVVRAGEARPACTIDPRPSVMKRLGELGRELNTAETVAEKRKVLDEWKKVSASDQDVRVFDIDPGTNFARVMVYADYLLKDLSNGTVLVDGVTGVADLLARRAQAEAAKGGPPEISLDMANRFWFNPGDIAYQTDGVLSLLSRCQLILLTEQEAVDANGKRTGEGKENPLAREFCHQVTERFAELARAQGIFAELEDLYRAVAVACLMYAEARKGGGLDVLDRALGSLKPARFEPVSTLPGRGNVKELTGKLPNGEYTIWLPSCGGVSVDIHADRITKGPAPAGLLEDVRSQITRSRRPASGSVTWTFPIKPEALRDPSQGDQDRAAKGPNKRPKDAGDRWLQLLNSF